MLLTATIPSDGTLKPGDVVEFQDEEYTVLRVVFRNGGSAEVKLWASSPTQLWQDWDYSDQGYPELYEEGETPSEYGPRPVIIRSWTVPNPRNVVTFCYEVGAIFDRGSKTFLVVDFQVPGEEHVGPELLSPYVLERVLERAAENEPA